MDSSSLMRWRPGSLTLGFLIATAIGLTLGVIGPFGSYLNDSLPLRIAYWTASLWAGWLLFGLIMRRIARLAITRGWPMWLWAPATVAILAVFPALGSRWIAVRLWPATAEVGPLEWYGQCLIISGLAASLILWRTGLIRPAKADASDPRDRLPTALGREVLCLQMEDHYVRVHTPRGSALLLMSLSQAVTGLKGIEGLQTHRSWWVARLAVEQVIEDGRNIRLRLKGGLEAPVSRSRLAILRDAGWLGSQRELR